MTTGGSVATESKHIHIEIRECVSVLVFCVWSLVASFVECGCCFLISFVDITKKKKKGQKRFETEGQTH